MTKSKYSTAFRLKSLSALIGVALVSGTYSRPANADCTTVANVTTCSGVSNLSTPIGEGKNTPSGASVTIEQGTTVTIGDERAINLGDNAVITLSTDSLVTNAASTKPPGRDQAGFNTIQFISNGKLTVEAGASIRATGEERDAEAVNVTGLGNTIINKGTISGIHSAAIWFQDYVIGVANTVENHGLISTALGLATKPGSVIGNNGGGAVHFTNFGGGIVEGSLEFQGGDDVLILYAGSQITGSFNGGGGNNSLELNGAQGSSDSLSGEITNFQSLEKTGGGEWTLSGTLGDNGGNQPLAVRVAQGQLVLTGDNANFNGSVTVDQSGSLKARAQSLPADVVNNGHVNFAQTNDGSYGGEVSGSGSVTKTEDGNLTLTGHNTYTGGTTIQAGTLSTGHDNALGAATGAVTLAGGTLALTGDVSSSRTIRISAATGTISTSGETISTLSGPIEGSGSLNSRGSGTLVLTGHNTYAGSTTITNGTLQLGNGGTSGSITGDVTNEGKLAFDRSDAVTFGGAISGTGSVTQQGSGTTILNAINTYQGTTTVNAGTLVVGDAAHTNAALSGGGGAQINAGGTLGGYGTVAGAVMNLGTITVANATPGQTGNGNFTITGDLSNNGLIQIGGTGVGNTLTTVGNYVGNNGVIALNTYLGSDGSPSDQLIIQEGATSGSTSLSVSNAGGLGAHTTGNGIRVLLADNGGQTSAGNFSLGAPVVTGPYEYTLYRGSVDESGPDNWYLRSANPAGVPNYRPEVSLYGSLAPTALEYGRTLIDSLHERVGEQEPWQDGKGDTLSMSQHRVWGRYIGANGTRAGANQGIYGNEGPHYDYRFSGMQIGADLWRRQREDGHRDMAGLTGAVGEATTTVEHYDGRSAGKGRINGYSLGAYWTHYGPRDWYVDTNLMVNWYRLRANSHRGLPEMKTDGWGLAANVEGGYPFHLNEQWVLEPQAQLTYQWIDIDTVHDGAANVRFQNVQSLVGRLGVRLAHSWTLDSGSKPRSITAWGRMSVLHEALGTPRTEFSSEAGYIPFHSDIKGSWTQILVGVTGQASDNLTLYASGGYQETFSGAKASGWNGKVGVRWQW